MKIEGLEDVEVRMGVRGMLSVEWGGSCKVEVCKIVKCRVKVLETLKSKSGSLEDVWGC